MGSTTEVTVVRVASQGTFTTRDARPTGERPVKRFSAAEEELSFWFGTAESVLGLHGTGFEGGGGQAVWDAAKIHAAHMKPRKFTHRLDMAKVARIGPTVSALKPESFVLIAIAYRPRRWSLIRPQADLDDKAETASPDTLASVTRRAGRMGCLAGVCLATKAVETAWAAREHAKKREPREPTAFDLLTFLRDEAQGGNPAKVLKPILAEAERILDVAIEEYDGLMQARITAARQAQDAEIARLRAGEGP